MIAFKNVMKGLIRFKRKKAILQKMKRKTLILFDIGAVLIKLSYSNFYREAAKHSILDEKAIEKAYLESTLDDRTSRGDITAEQFFRELREK